MMAKESMKDLEKQVTEHSMDALPPVQVKARDKEQDLLILVDGCINPVQGGGGIADKMNLLGLKNWRLPYWLIAGSVIVMTNHIHVARNLMIPPEIAVFALFLCGTGLVYLAMKKMM